MKIAFYIPNKNISNINLSNIDEGNPGIGGSEFSAVLIASNLCKKLNHEIYAFCDKKSNFPSSLKWQVCGDIIGAIKLSIKQNFDFIIIDGKLLTKEIICTFTNVRFIAWANTFISKEYLDFFSRMDNVINIINVGKEQLHLTKNHPIYKKSTFIYNAVPTGILKKFPNMTPNFKREHNVCYIGSLHPAKGFQFLAQAWPKVLKEVPDANLFIIGSGKLYGRNAQLGKWGIAKEEFEEEFMPYITQNGKIIDSVHFLGILGNEKYSILEKCKVGVPNPSGVSETFGYTAVEMEMMGCQVTTIKCPGYMDTVFNKKNLYNNTDQLSKYIIKLLIDNSYNYHNIDKFLDLFSVRLIVNQWIDYLSQLDKNKPIHIKKNLELYTYKFVFYKNQIKQKIKTLLKSL